MGIFTLFEYFSRMDYDIPRTFFWLLVKHFFATTEVMPHRLCNRHLCKFKLRYLSVRK